MTPALLTAALVALTLVAYTLPSRCPDDLLSAELPDWQKVVWLAVRKTQGSNASAWAGRDHYAAMTGKDKTQVSRALTDLKAAGWLVELGRRGRDPELQCHVPEGAGGRPDGPVSVNPRHSESEPSSLSPTPPNKDESGQGIRSGNPVREQQQHAGAGARGKKQPPVLTPEQADHRRRLVALEVFDQKAQGFVRAMDPAWVAQVIAAGEHLQRRGRTRGLGGLVVAIAEGREELPALDSAPSPAPTSGPGRPMTDARRAELAQMAAEQGEVQR